MHHRTMTALRYTLLVLSALALFACNRSGQVESRELTFNDSIAPIIFRNCSPCHRPGSAAPFSLLSYEDVKRHARTIQLTVSNRSMPPWPADPEYTHFREEKWLSDREIEAINAWIGADMPEGDPNHPPSAPAFTEGSAYGKPDLVVSMRAPFPLPGDNKDRFMMMKIPIELPQDTFVRAIEIVPGNRKLAHHINGHLIVYQAGKKRDIQGGKE
ncbi:MAG: cytochrome c, partial [Bacteroidia bacterium]|nr:cytochrome c [Bacteroidia bacterium]